MLSRSCFFITLHATEKWTAYQVMFDIVSDVLYVQAPGVIWCLKAGMMQTYFSPSDITFALVVTLFCSIMGLRSKEVGISSLFSSFIDSRFTSLNER